MKLDPNITLSFEAADKGDVVSAIKENRDITVTAPGAALVRIIEAGMKLLGTETLSIRAEDLEGNVREVMGDGPKKFDD